MSEICFPPQRCKRSKNHHLRLYFKISATPFLSGLCEQWSIAILHFIRVGKIAKSDCQLRMSVLPIRLFVRLSTFG
jgi:hypothetical protein